MLKPLGGGRDDTAALLAYFQANSPGRAELGPGRFLTAGLSLAGLSCSISGCDDATTIKGIPGHRGPVLDFTGYRCPDGMRTLRSIGGFTVEGDGVAGVEKRGIVLGDCVGMVFRGIAILNTGGCCLELGGSQLCHFERITLNTPVDAARNNVPYIRAIGAFNGNSLSRIGLRSYSTTGDVAVGGAAQFLAEPGNGIFAPCHNLFDAWWYEYQHLPAKSTLFTLEGNYNRIRDFQYFDVFAMQPGSGTSAFRVLAPPKGKEDYGANRIDGYLYGGLNGGPDCGVEMWQRANSVSGTKGKGGRNVVLMPQARFTSVAFDACEQEPDPSSHGVVDHAGSQTVLDGSVSIDDRPNGYRFMGGGPSGATLHMGNGQKLTPQGLFLNDDQYWTEYGITPGVGVRWPGSGTLTSGPNESLRYVGWEERPLGSGNRRQGWVVPPMRGK